MMTNYRLKVTFKQQNIIYVSLAISPSNELHFIYIWNKVKLDEYAVKYVQKHTVHMYASSNKPLLIRKKKYNQKISSEIVTARKQIHREREKKSKSSCKWSIYILCGFHWIGASFMTLSLS